MLAILASTEAIGQRCDSRSLRAELDRRADIDQRARDALLKDMSNRQAEERTLKADADNTAWMRGMLTACGWPRRSAVGDVASRQAWMLAQHADMAPDFLVYAAEKLKSPVLAHEAEPMALALLVDRNRRLQHKPQVYGLQYQQSAQGQVVFFDIEDPGHIDDRRAAIGLPAFYCYVMEVSQETGQPIVWPPGVLFRPHGCGRIPKRPPGSRR